VDLRLKDDLLAVIEGEGEASEDTLANKGLVTQYSHGNAYHLSNICIKLRKTNGSQKDRRQALST
jgi:hypothetical protein